jgi:hypothetical protein
MHPGEEGKGFIWKDISTTHNTIGLEDAAGYGEFFNNIFDGIFLPYPFHKCGSLRFP